MKSFNVINYNFNKKKFEAYNVIPYLVQQYNDTIRTKYKPTPKTFKEFKKFIKEESMYQFWSRCQYEIILTDWPSQKHAEKWDVYKQIIMNLDTITKIVMESVRKI